MKEQPMDMFLKDDSCEENQEEEAVGSVVGSRRAASTGKGSQAASSPDQPWSIPTGEPIQKPTRSPSPQSRAQSPAQSKSRSPSPSDNQFKPSNPHLLLNPIN